MRKESEEKERKRRGRKGKCPKSPPGSVHVVPAGLVSRVGVVGWGKMPVENVAVAEEDIHPAAAFVVVPIVVRVVDAAIRMPRPIGTDEFGDRPKGNFGSFDGGGGSRIQQITSNMLGARKIARPFDQVAVTPTVPTTLGHRVEPIAMVGGAVEGGQVGGINVQGPVCWPLVTAIGVGKTSQIRNGRPLAAERRPAIMIRITLPVVLGVHVKGEPDLMLVAVTLSLEPLGLGSRQGRQQHGCQDGNDGNHYEQFDQGEAGFELLRFVR